MGIQNTILGTVANIGSAFSGIMGEVSKIGEIENQALKRVSAIQTAKQQQMERVRSFKAKYKDFGGKEGYMNALSTYKKSEKMKKEG